MSTKVISSDYPSGYLMSAATLTVTSTGSIGGIGLSAAAAATVVNYGEILATNGGANGVVLNAGGTITNGNAGSYLNALIAGAVGVQTAAYSAAATLVNYGTVDGTGGTAVLFQSAGDVLVVEAGSDFLGVVHGYFGGGVLRLGTAHGPGAISGFGSAFQNFETYQVDSGGAWTLAGANTIGSGATLSVLGALTIAGSLASQGGIDVTGSLLVTGSLANAGSISGEVYLAGGTLTNGAGHTISSAGYTVFGEAAGGAVDTVFNFGAITSSAGSGPAVELGFNGPGILVNGATGATAALVSGYTGLNLYGHATVVNYGTILGRDGTAVYDEITDSPQTNLVVVEAGSVFDGKVVGNGGTLELGAGAGAGTLSGLGIQFVSYGVFEIQAGGTWSLGVSNTFANFGTALNDGTLHGTTGYALVLAAGGTIANGSGGDTAALVIAPQGIEITYGGASVVAGVVANYGTIDDTSNSGEAVQVALAQGGGQVTNGSVAEPGALISGGSGISFTTTGTIANFGTVVGRASEGVFINGGGTVTNGSGVDASARILGNDDGIGIVGGLGTVTNFGTVIGAGHYGVALGSGGSVVNGSAEESAALIEGAGGVALNASGAVDNYGTILSTGVANAGVLTQGGTVTNGSAEDSRAEITGVLGIEGSGSVTVANFGTIAGSSNAGVFLEAGGSVTNGNGGDPAALISGSSGILADAAASVVNGGTVRGSDSPAGYGIYLGGGGTLTNGSAGDGGALVEGYTGVRCGGSAVVTNLGTLEGLSGDGVVLAAGGSVTNGAVNDPLALLEGVSGLLLAGGATATNLAIIRGTGEAGSAGVFLGAGTSLTNGSHGHSAALVEGYVGASLAGTLINFGTIAGAAGTAVLLTSSAGVVKVEAGAVFSGKVIGDGGTLDLASGAGPGALTGLGGQFTGFALEQVLTGATWTLTGTNVVATGATLIDHGVLDLSGSLTNNGTLKGGVTLTGGHLANSAGHTVSGSGTLVAGSGSVTNLGGVASTGAGSVGIGLAGGAVVNGSATDTTALVSGVTGLVLSGAGTVTNFATITGTGGTAVLFKSSKDVLVLESKGQFVGKVVGGGGTLDLASGTGTLAGLGGSIAGFGLVDVLAGGHWSVSGTSTIASSTKINDQGVLTNSGTILDSGAVTVAVGGTALVNQASAVLDFEGSSGIAASGAGTGATLSNAGLLDKLGAGTSTIAVKIANAGMVEAASGTLDLQQAVSGTGTLALAGAATLELAGAVAAGQTVDFTAGAEILALSDTAGFAGALSGFAATDKLDLTSFAFSGSETAVFTPNVGDTGGTLVVTDGALHLSVTLFGQYVTAGFTLAAQGAGSVVSYHTPAAPAASLAASG